MSDSPTLPPEPPRLRGYPLAAVVLFISIIAALASLIDLPKVSEFVRDYWDYIDRDDVIGVAGLCAIAGAFCGAMVLRRWWGLILGMGCGVLLAAFVWSVTLSSPSVTRLAAAGAMVLITALVARAGSR